ncbi:MAG: hypothetical protein J6Y13_11105 [Treponema sp.]|nr:hypothetical protein [Treponema sp.]
MKVKFSKLLTALCLPALLLTSGAASQVPNQSEQLRIQIWSELDPFPGGFGDGNKAAKTAEADGTSPGTGLSAAEASGTAAAGTETSASGTEPSAAPLPSSGGDAAYEAARTRLYSFAIGRAKEISPFFLAGMLSGWTFDYTPYDKSRGVDEFFEFGEITPFDWSMNSITYKDPLPEDNKLLVWAYCDRTELQQLSYRRWSSINLPKVRGRGRASVEKGFEGIQEAVGNAIKDAVREYWRIYSKNKPKEITGRVLLIGVPRVYILEGQYVTDLEFFLETDRIVKYTYF